MTRIVEKPSTPISKLANIGLYYIRAVDSLWQGIDHVLASPKNKGEYFLTDAFQWMIEHGKRILTAEVGGWYDCGKLGHAAGDQRDPAAQGRGAAAWTFPASPSTIRSTSRTASPSSGARSGPTSPSSGAPGVATAGSRNTIVGRDAVLTARAARRRAARAISVVLEGYRGQRVAGRSLRGDAKADASLGTHARGSMASVDDLCRSYLDLKYHFDPAAASAAGLVVARRPAGPVRRRDGARAPVRAAVGRRRGRGAGDRRPAGGDRPHRAAGRDPRPRSSGWSTSSPTCGTRSSGCHHRLPGLYAMLARRDDGGRRPRAGGARAAPGRPRVPRRGARATLDEPPSVFVDTALAHAGRRRRAGGAARRRARRRSARAARTSSSAAAGQALEALKRFGTALRDEIEPAADPHAFAIGEEQFSRRLHHEHALMAGAPGALALRAAPPGGDRRPSSPRWPASSARGPGASWWRSSGTTRPTPDAAAAGLPGGAGPGPRLRGRAGPGGDSATMPVDVVPTPAVPGGAGALRRLRAAADLSSARRPGRFYVTAARPVAAGRGAAPSSAGATAATRIPAMVAHEAYPGHHLQLVTAAGARRPRCAGTSGRRSWWRAGRSTASSSWTRRATTGRPSSAPLPAGEPALARHPGRARRRPAHPRHDAGGGGGLHGGAPADRAARARRPRCAATARGPPTSSAMPWDGASCCSLRDAYRERAGRGRSSRSRFHDELLAYGGLPVSLARWGMDLAE